VSEKLDESELEWTVDTVPEDARIKTLRGYIEVTVRHPPSGASGWAVQKTEALARAKALARLYFTRDYG
jgi:hypothetical protein